MVDAGATVALETLRNLLIKEAKFLYDDDDRVEEVDRQLQTMHSFLKDADKRRDHYNLETVKDWVSDLRNLSTRAENVLERYAKVQSKRQRKTLKKIAKRLNCILGEISDEGKSTSDYRRIIKEIEDIRSDMADLINRAESITTKIGESSSSPVNHDVIWTVDHPFGGETEQHFVGMTDEIQLLESLLTSSDETSDRVIFICGMGGLGKTTLATKIYRGVAAKRYFNVRAWVCISQQFQLKNVLQELLKQFLPNNDQNIIRDMEEEELRAQLFGAQEEKKCLVVVDDIWEADHWNTLSSFFRISEGRCRVLVTTRNEKIGSGDYHVHHLKYLSEDECWYMLQKIALPPGLDHSKWPLLEIYGREMVRKCGFLPLAVSVIGEILRQENTLRGWNKVRENIVLYLQRGDGVQVHKKVEQVLALSYNVLPYNLKYCFLYLGCFPEDTDIPAEELYLLWMAEGMISSQDRRKEETLRDVAEGYLSELANRHMVELKMGEASAYSRFKSCRLHDVMRDFCLLKGKEERFLEVVDTKMIKKYVFPDRRLAIHLDKPQVDIRGFENLQSLMYPMKGKKPFREWNSLVSVNFGIFKSLKILILQGFKSGDRELPKGIEKLILLKHLSVRGSELHKLPSAISKLSSLQSLDLRTYGEIELPYSIHKLKSLRHLVLHPYQREVIGGLKLKLSSFITLETLIGYNSDLDDIIDLTELPNLRVFDGIVCSKKILSMIVDHILKHQDQFRETRLYISSVDGCSTDLLRKTLMCHSLSWLFIGNRVKKLPLYEAQLGKNLIRLQLVHSDIPKDPMEMLEKLPMLRILSILEGSFTGNMMNCRANGFPELRVLTLRGLTNLVRWSVDEGAMPNLSKLRIRDCRKLEKIPKGLQFITTLKELKIEDMPPEFEDRLTVVEDKEGKDYHKIRHTSSIQIIRSR